MQKPGAPSATQKLHFMIQRDPNAEKKDTEGMGKRKKKGELLQPQLEHTHPRRRRGTVDETGCKLVTFLTVEQKSCEEAVKATRVVNRQRIK